MSVTRETERESRWLTVGEVARLLRVSRDTVERWIHNGNLRAVNVGTRSTLASRRRSWRVSAESLEGFLEGRAILPPPPPSPKVRPVSQTDIIEFIK
jgi:excisionase family DNA binding protein